MAYYDDPDIDFLTEEEKLKRAQVDIDALRKFKQGPVPTEEVGGYTLSTGQKIPGLIPKMSKVAAYAPVAMAGLAGFQQTGQDERRKELTLKEKADLVDYMKNYTKGTRTSDNPAEILEGGEPNKAVYTPPTDEERLAMATEGIRRGNPLVTPTATEAYKDLIVKAPDRAQARAATAVAKQEANNTKMQLAIIADQRAAQNEDGRNERNAANIAARAALKAQGVDPDKGWKNVGTAENGDVTWARMHNGQMETKVFDSAGKMSTAFGKAEAEKAKATEDAAKAIGVINRAESLLPKSTGSLIGSKVDELQSWFGKSNIGAETGNQLATIGNELTMLFPRMAGQVSDADLKFLIAQSADLGNTAIPVERRAAALRAVKARFAAALNKSDKQKSEENAARAQLEQDIFSGAEEQPEGSFTGKVSDVLKGINNIKDPYERVRAMMAWENQYLKSGAPKTKSSFVRSNPQATPPMSAEVPANGNPPTTNDIERERRRKEISQKYNID